MTVALPNVTSTLLAEKLVICKEIVSISSATAFAETPPNNGTRLGIAMGRKGFENNKRYTGGVAGVRCLPNCISFSATLTALSEVSDTLLFKALDCEIVKRDRKFKLSANPCSDLMRNLTSAVREYTGHLLRSESAIVASSLAVANFDSAASFSACLATKYNLEFSPSEIICNRWPKEKMPPSASSSPKTPTITIRSNNRLRFLNIGYSFFLWSAKYSPTSPPTNTMPKINRAHSEIESHAAAQGFDSENISNLISYYLAVAGFALQAVGLSFLLILRLLKQNGGN